jgi:hypothetical protein
VPSFEFIKNHQPQLFPNPEGEKAGFHKRTNELAILWPVM